MCRFNDKDRLNGEEMLITTESAPFSGKADSGRTFAKMVENLKGDDRSNSISMSPVIISYDMVEEVFGIRLKNSSEWPHFSYITPDSVVTGSVKRPAGTLAVGGTTPQLADRDKRILRESIGDVRDRIREGELLQAVISHQFPISHSVDSFGLMKHLLASDRSRYVYYYKFGEMEVVGSSPENVYRQDGSHALIHPIAGTRQRKLQETDSKGRITELLTDTKELCEHRMLVDLARNDLARISEPGTVEVTGDMIPEEFSSVIHLVSTVESRLINTVSPIDVLLSIFPAGTVSGAPKRRAIEIIDSHEVNPRGGYAGAIGLMGPYGADLALGIRTLFRTHAVTYTQAGAGIVKDSVPEREVEEIIAKAGTILSGVQL
ncbi:MAG: anthranilate synthase component I family protein [Thermoplasmataceae archaeon]